MTSNANVLQSVPAGGRLQHIDALKGFCMLYICAVHFMVGVIPAQVYTFFTFAVPAFFFTSGWVYGVKTPEWSARATFRKRLRRLGVPYMWFSILLLVVTLFWVAIGHFPLYTLPRDIFKTVCLRGIGTLWFLPVLGFGEVLFCWLMSVKGRRHLLALAGMVAVTILAQQLYAAVDVTGSLHPAVDAAVYPWICVLDAWMVIYAGYWCSRLVSPKLPAAPSRRCRMAALAAGLLLLALNYTQVFLSFTADWPIHRIVYTVVPSVGLICVFYAMSGSAIVTFFSYWGFNSLILMCTHYTITLEVCRIFDGWLTEGAEFAGPRTALYLAACVLLTYPLVRLFRRRPFLQY